MNRVRRKTLERKDSGISVGEDERREAREACLEGVGVREVVGAGLGLGPNALAALQGRGAEEEAWSSSASPLGLSNYDALDEEDDWYDSYHEEDGEGEEDGDGYLWPRSPKAMKRDEKREKAYYADWNVRDADEEDELSEEHVVNVPVIPAELIASEKRPPSPPEGRIIEILKEQEREQEIISGFRHFT